MRELQQKQRFKRRLYSTPALIALLAFTIILGRGAYAVWQKKAASERYVSELQTQASDLEAQDANVSQAMQELGTDSGLEKALKEKYNVARDGEHVVILVHPEATATEATDTGPWYRRFWSDIISAL